MLLTVGFFLTYDGIDTKKVKSKDEMSQEQLEAIKKATEDPENLKILGNMEIEKENKLDPSKLNIEDIEIGAGKEVKDGDEVAVHYVGNLLNGEKFDSSRDRGVPFTFVVGAGRVIQGWEKGILGMKEGGVRKLTIPPALGYGAQGIPGAIPSNAILVFEIELLNIRYLYN